ncbi:MAG: RidA family protein [Acidobacteriota bacterium]|nr:RidA family protein [Acidobacteriota bacterium]
MLLANPKGNYSFLRGIDPYSAGTVAHEGYEIVHVRFRQPVPLTAGIERIKRRLAAVERPAQALCGMELRSPQPFSFRGFNEFNASYVRVLRDWGIFHDGVNPVARTNIAPAIGAPSTPSLYGFSHTAPSLTKAKTFIVAGAGELPEGSLDVHDVVRRGEISSDAIQEKARFVMGLMAGRLRGLEVSWDLVTAVDIYTAHPICGILAEDLIRPMGASAIHGVTWHYSRPPIVSIEFEMDMRGCERELVLG